ATPVPWARIGHTHQHLPRGSTMSKSTEKKVVEKPEATPPANGTPAKATKPRRQQRTIEERIAELRVKAAEQDERRQARLRKQYAEALAQRDTHQARYEAAAAAVASLEEQLAP